VPELPDVELYLTALRARIAGHTLERVRLATPFLLRSVDPPLHRAEGQTVAGFRRIGKRIVWEMEGPSNELGAGPWTELGTGPSTTLGAGGLFLVFHLMIAGRFKWRERGTAIPRKVGLAAFDFPHGTLLLTEVATQKRASLHVVQGEEALASFNPGGLEVMTSDAGAFAAALQKESHTLKHALTDPHLFSGIGNAYSDEILHRARLSPFKLTRQLTSEETAILRRATIDTLAEWTTRLQDEAGDKFPEKVTAFHQGMAVHGRFGEPCPRCGTPVQRIVHGEHEVNYCPSCQTEGRLLADRALSKLLKDDWPKTLEELERRRKERST
jgi:formamidopyrimidine-DNA glycosylase